MPWNPNIPQANDKLSNSQLQLLNNFQAIDTGFSFNHVNLNLADAGKHNLLTMPQQTFPQSVTGSDLLFYVGLEPVTALSQLYLKRSTDAGNGIPLTAGNTDNATFGWAYLPFGAIIKWGVFSFSGAVPVAITMQGPAYTSSTSYSVTVSSGFTFFTYTALNNNGTQFLFESSIAGVESYRFIAIGT
jgi:hypothetical protein